MKFKYWILLTIIGVIAFSFNVNALTGVCTLDKETYSSGETALFSCVCTSPQEENVIGNFVWRNDTGTILQNTTTNSGACRTSFFDSTLLFPSGFAILGNITFETQNINWQDPTDITSDNFNVSQPGVNDCIITTFLEELDPTVEPLKIGEESGIEVRVFDSLSGGSLVNAQCKLDIIGVDGRHLLNFPQTISSKQVIISQSNGEISVAEDLDHDFWRTNTTYTLEAHCFCINDSNVPGTACYNELTGSNAGFKACSVSTPITTSISDTRLNNNNDRTGGLAVLLYVAGITLIFFILPFIKEDFSRLKWLDLLLKRLSWVFGISLMFLNSGLIFTMAKQSGLDVQGELAVYFRIVSIALYLMLFYTTWKTFVDFVHMHQTNELTKRGIIDE